MNFTFKENAPQQGNSDGFWYGLDNGYIKPEEVLSDPQQLAILEEALEIVNNFERDLREAGLMNEDY